jgi:hypothetical protein
MNGTAVSKKGSLLVHSLIFSSTPSMHSPPEDEPNSVSIYTREALRIISEDDSPRTQDLSRRTRMSLIKLQRILRINNMSTPRI